MQPPHLRRKTQPGKPIQMWQASLKGDVPGERVQLQNGRVSIFSGESQEWQSPASWRVASLRVADLNRDGREELALLVWRPFKPWPVESILPHGGRISGNQNAEGYSCHLVLIGWRGEAWRELWAGSALARPLAAIEPADVDGDGSAELAVLEGNYTDTAGSPASSLAVWSWNGFGFDLLTRQNGSFQQLGIITEPGLPDLLRTYP